MRPRPHPLTNPTRWPGFDRPLPRTFFDRPTLTVARDLLGQLLVHRRPGGDRVGRIVETESYGPDDPANHAFRGPTRRNASMFLRPGTLYVYRLHQVCCANVVTRPGEAVLLRAAEPLSGDLASARGPGRLCRAFGLDLGLDGSDLCLGPLRLLPRSVPVGRILRGPRVGISKARDRPWRFAVARSREVSLPRPPGVRSFSA